MNDVTDRMAAEHAKRVAMDQVEANANYEWREYMLDRLWEVALDFPRFTSDDVYDYYYAAPGPRPVTHEQRAMGPVFNAAAKLGFCRKAPIAAVSSRRRSRHAAPLTVWDSLIYEGPKT